MGKPFIKWAGGKRQLLPVIEQNLPQEFGTAITKYAEPFIGGGALLFHILDKYPAIEEVYLSDLNHALIATYRNIQANHLELIDEMQKLQGEYLCLSNLGAKQEYYLTQRKAFNELLMTGEENVQLAALFVFLNRTGFNGMYRVNKKGELNIPFGKHENPAIYDRQNIDNLHETLSKATIVLGGYEAANDWVDEKTFLYADPPYRPITASASFNSYTNSTFNDATQADLAAFLHKQSEKGASIMLSNSDPHNTDPEDDFFDDLYSWANIQRVSARRNINSDGKKRGAVSEILVTNY